MPIADVAKEYGPFDLIFEGTGNSAVVFDSMQALGKNGVLVLASVTGGDKMIQPTRKISLQRCADKKLSKCRFSKILGRACALFHNFRPIG